MPSPGWSSATSRGAGGRFPEPGRRSGNYVHVDDVIDGHLAAMAKGRPGEAYILGGDNATYRDFFATLAAVSGKDQRLYPIPIGYADGLRLDRTEARRLVRPEAPGHAVLGPPLQLRLGQFVGEGGSGVWICPAFTARGAGTNRGMATVAAPLRSRCSPSDGLIADLAGLKNKENGADDAGIDAGPHGPRWCRDDFAEGGAGNSEGGLIQVHTRGVVETDVGSGHLVEIW